MLMLPEERAMSSPSGILVVFLCLALLGSCHAMALTTNMASKVWSQLEEVSQPTDRHLPSDLPLWTAWATGANMAVTASPVDLWTSPSVSAEERGAHGDDSQQGAVPRPSSEFTSMQRAVGQGTFHFSEPDDPDPSLTHRLVNSESTWADEEHMPDLHFRHAQEDSAPTDASSLAAQTPLSSAPAQEWSAIDTASAATVAPPLGSSGTPDLGTSIPALTLHPDTRPTGSRVTDTGLDTDDAVDSQGEGTEVTTSVLHEEDSAVRPTEELAFITDSFAGVAPDDAWSDTDPLSESSSLPDCNAVTTGVCNTSETSWAPPPPPPPPPPPGGDKSVKSNGDLDDLSSAPFPPVTVPLPLLVPLLADWNAAVATWGLAWEAHVYGLGCMFALVAAISALCLLCLPLRRPAGCGLFAAAHLLQLLTGAGRAFLLFYDPYGQRERLPGAGVLLLHEAPFPCLTAAFGAALLLLSARSRTRLLPRALLQRSSCALAALLLTHAALALGFAGLEALLPGVPCLALVPPGAFVALALLLATAYLLFYCHARADAKHIYRLSEASPERSATDGNAANANAAAAAAANTPRHASQCPFSEAGVWERAAGTGVFAALFLLACSGLRLYAMLLAAGVAGGGQAGLPPWPWWGLQFSLRGCEAGVCLTLALIITHPLLYCGQRAAGMSKPPRWPGFAWRSGGGGSGGSGKPSLLPGGYGWSLRPGEKLCEGLTRKESESVPLYTLADQRFSETDGLDLHYPSTPTDLTAKRLAHSKLAKAVSMGSSFASLDGGLYSDSTVDLRPPSPIDLRRSIDEALFSESLFSRSIFCSSRLSLSTRGPPDGQPCRGPSAAAAEPGLYRTSSCGDVDQPAAGADASRPSHRGVHTQRGAWRGSSSASLCGGHFGGHGAAAAHGAVPLTVCCAHIVPGQEVQRAPPRHPSQRRYPTLGSTSSRESLCDTQLDREQVDELAVQAEFINVCRQIDALSVSSDTIDL
ncbi:proline-rich transmembrane protein 4 [Sardina pilchardus]|uniref:proline-rich transmembrane protein 4 n=1 Tax=Sardina pilchardus TaxID=27697 RepID=UPI002E1026B7